MKKILYLFTAIILIWQTSCSKFLKETSGDLLIPVTIHDYAALLNNEGYRQDMLNATKWIVLMTDDIDMGPMKGSFYTDIDSDAVDGLFAYNWSQNIEEKLTDKAWTCAYSGILGCNLIIQAIPIMTYENNEFDLYNSLIASAYTLRAYYYFCLVNWYALPYSIENLSELGVIIQTSPDVTLDKKERSTIGEVYDLINSDIETAIEYGEKGREVVNKFLISNRAIQFLANRVALFQKDYNKVISQGEPFIQLNNKLFNLSSEDETTFGLDDDAFTILHLDNNPEIIFSFGEASSSSNSYDYLTWNSTWGIGFKVNKDGDNALIPLYKDGDLRLSAYYKVDYEYWGETEYVNNYPLKYIGVSDNVGYKINWRNIEVFLNVAEAYAFKDAGISDKSIEILNKIRVNRFRAGYTPLTVADFSSKQDLINFVWDERRRELAFEETMRWWDIRRQGCKSITHKYYNSLEVSSVDTYVLPENSPNFVMQIPAIEIGANSIITTNEREVIKKDNYGK